MPEIRDIITLPTADCQYVPVNTGAAFVQTLPGAAATFLMKNASNANRFHIGDSFIIESMGFTLAEALTLWKHIPDIVDPCFKVTILLQGVTSGLVYNIDTLGLNQTVFLPLENFETGMDIFCDYTKQRSLIGSIPLAEPFRIYCQTMPETVSMAGVPAALNGKTLVINPFMKILHNMAMY